MALDRATCVGHGRCYALAPDVFGEDDEGYCVVLAPDVPPEHETRARLAVVNCPEEALRVES